jgi:hypothetical protein
VCASLRSGTRSRPERAVPADSRENDVDRKFRKGDRVEWNTSQGTTFGRIKRKLTAPFKIKGHRVAASRSNPEYLVESEKSGEVAAHKPGALRRRSKSGKGG